MSSGTSRSLLGSPVFLRLLVDLWKAGMTHTSFLWCNLLFRWPSPIHWSTLLAWSHTSLHGFLHQRKTNSSVDRPCWQRRTSLSLRKKKEYPLQSLSSSYSIKRSDYFTGSHSVYLSIHPFGQSVSLSVYKSIGQSVSTFQLIREFLPLSLVRHDLQPANQANQAILETFIRSINLCSFDQSASQPAVSQSFNQSSSKEMNERI